MNEQDKGVPASTGGRATGLRPQPASQSSQSSVPNAVHTPGPWAYRPQEYDDWGFVRAAPNEAGEQWPVALARAGHHVSRDEEARHRHNGTDPYEANARLIAAAPDLYEAMAHIVGASHEAPRFGPFDQIDNDGQPYQSADFEAALQKCRAALAKARGEQ